MKKILFLLIGIFLCGLFSCSGVEQDQLNNIEKIDNKTESVYISPYSYCAQYGIWDTFGESPNGESNWDYLVTGTGSIGVVYNTALAKYPPYAAKMRSTGLDPLGSYTSMYKQFDSFNGASLWLSQAPKCNAFHEQNTYTGPATNCLVYAWFKPMLRATNHITLQVIDPITSNNLSSVSFNIPGPSSGWQELDSPLMANCPQKIIVKISIDDYSTVVADDVYVNWYY